jgi:hypothetical protein
MAAPLKLTLYDPETDEVIQEYSRSFIPWKLLKQAMRLARSLEGQNLDDLDESMIDELAGLVAEVFGNRFSVQQLNDGSDLNEMLTVLTSIITRAAASMPVGPNPTRPG